MPRCDGVSATRLIKAERPEIRIVMLTMSAGNEDLFAAIRSGACGYLLKTLDTDEFFALFESLAHGEGRVLARTRRTDPAGVARERSQPQAAPASPAWRALSARQVGVLTLVSNGMTYKEVAAQARPDRAHRQISHGRDHGAASTSRNREEVLAYARGTGLLRPDS